jgi:hypothetical protein
LRQADLTTAVTIRVMTSETPARETPTMAVAVLMSEGYAGLLPPQTVLRAGCTRGRVDDGVRALPLDLPVTKFSSGLVVLCGERKTGVHFVG